MLAPALALCLGLPACSRHDTPAAAAAGDAAAAPASAAVAQATSLKREALMQIAFPGWRDDAEGRVAVARLPDQDFKGKEAVSLQESSLDVKPIQVVRLDETHAVMLTEGVELDEDGTPLGGHASGAWLGVYFFTRDGGHWRLSRRIDGYDCLGAQGLLGRSRVDKVSATDFAMTLTWGSCWQGYCGSWASVYRLAPGQITTLLDTVPMSAENSGALEPCGDALAGKPPAPGASGADSQDDGEQTCFSVDGKPAFAAGVDAPGDLTLTFQGEEVKLRAGKAPRRRSLDASVHYRFADGKYVLSQGENPVPSF